MLSPNSKDLRPASLPYRHVDPNAGILRTRKELHDCVRDLLSPMIAVRRFVNVIVDVAKGRYDR